MLVAENGTKVVIAQGGMTVSFNYLKGLKNGQDVDGVMLTNPT